MENRVILARSRYETMIYELAELTAKVEALQRQVEEWERLYEGQPTPETMGPLELYPGTALGPRNFAFDEQACSATSEQRRRHLSSLKTVVRDFLKNNADLANDEESVRMLQFCLRNYIDLNPELNALPLGKKLEMAANMAREFMIQVCNRGG